MIKHVILKNFQSHKNTEITLDKGFNAIIGESDAGKSVIVKAVEWLRTNRPFGKQIENAIHIGETEIAVVVDNVIRERTKKDTGSYTVNKADGEETYSVLNKDVPPQVTNEMNLDDINVQLQLDGHFLILETPGKAASYLNSITKLDKLDNALSELRSRKLGVNAKLRQLDDELEDVNEYLTSGIVDEYEKLRDIEKQLIEKQNKADELNIKGNTIYELLQDIELFEQKKLSSILVANLDIIVESIFKEMDKINELQENQQNIEKLLLDIETLEKQKVSEDLVNGYQDIIFKIAQEIEEIDILKSGILELGVFINSYTTLKSTILKLKTEYKEVNVEYLKMKKLIVNCPTCGSKLTEITRKTLLEK